MRQVDSEWWRGAKGEWYVVIQIALFILVMFGPHNLFYSTEWSPLFANFATAISIPFAAFGATMIAAGIFTLRKSITPLPYPLEGSTLIESGPFKIVRHPIYCGGFFLATGWALWVHGWLTLCYAAILFIFLDIKSRREEGWLKERFSNYVEYQKRTRKLIPFLY